ncbi:MAG TPA: hypothetical protein H9986_01535 [Candidatus Prevotella stercoripullorum]|nr:hypothetical protein [Candidatus Prevotella stercoripullorum]
MMDKYVINESPAFLIILWALCVLSVYFSYITNYDFWCVAGIFFFFVIALWKSVVLVTCRQKLVVDAEGIHYAEREWRKLVWRHYCWKDVKCCYFNYLVRGNTSLGFYRLLCIVTSTETGNERCDDIWLEDFEFAFRLSRLKRAIVDFSGNSEIVDDCKTSANRKGCIRYCLIVFLILILIAIVCEIMSD